MPHTIEYEQKSFGKDFLLVCSLGLNVGFIFSILFIL